MFKAVYKTHQGRPVLLLGLSRADVQQLKEDLPILFSFAADLPELPQLRGVWCFIVYQHPDGRIIALPDEATPPGAVIFGCPLSDEALANIGGMEDAAGWATPLFNAAIFIEENEEVMERKMMAANLIREHTVIRREGYTPTDTHRPSDN